MTDQSDSRHEPSTIAVAVLAAGHGSRMKSARPKHVHPVAGIPMVKRIVRSAQEIQPDHIAVVVSPAMMDLPQQLDMEGEFIPVEMEVPTGTAHAVLKAIEGLPPVDYIVSLLGDNPLLTGDTIQALVDQARQHDSLVTILTCVMPDGAKYGRIRRDHHRRAVEIVEFKNDVLSERTNPMEINSGIMVLKRDWALDAIRRMPQDENTGEYLLTDLVSMAVAEATDDAHWPVATVEGPDTVSVGINTRLDQADADSKVRKMVRARHFENGVSMVGPETIFIDETVEIGQDTMLLPGTILMGDTHIGTGCTIGPYAVLIDTVVGNGVTIRSSTIENSTIMHAADAGPYAHIRAESVVGEHAHVGNYVELKRTIMDAHAKSGHFSYLGDTHVGEHANIGAGSITANYDGIRKNYTEIGEGAFIGCDTVLIAPVNVGPGARTGAGSVVNRDVAAGQTVVGIPARPIKSKHKHEE